MSLSMLSHRGAAAVRSAASSFVQRRGASAKTPSFISDAPRTDVTRLASGMRVATEGGFGQTATVGVFIDAGSRNECAATSGAAHFLEHLTFKGTNKRTQEQLEREIENMGGHLNAYTSREVTVYFAKVFKDDVPRAVEILSDTLFNSKLDKDAIERERDVILREMEEVEKTDQEFVFDRLHETAFRGSSLSRTILGSVDNIRSLKREQLQAYIDKHYTAPRIVVAGAGAVTQEQLVELTQKHFGGVPTQPKGGEAVKFEQAYFTGSDIRVRDDDQSIGKFAIAFGTPGWTSPYAVHFMLMQSILGSWDRSNTGGRNMASQLLRDVSGDHDAHSVMSFNTTYKDIGLFGIYATGGPTCLYDLSSHAMDAFNRLVHKTSDEEVARARVQLKTALLSSLDDTTSICEDIGRQLLTYGRRLTPAEIVARVDSVTADDIKKTAYKFLHDQDVAIASAGPIHEFPDYTHIRRRTYWLRY